jgi:carboxymethylenebutenolidase
MPAPELITEGLGLLNAKADDLANMTRRMALKATLGVGYAAAAAPVQSQTAIKTSSAGLLAGEIIVEVGGFKMNAYRAAPQGKTNLPVLLVIHEVFGVHEYIADVCRRFAHAGYLAIAPELFQRQGEPTEYNVLADLYREIVEKVPDAQVMTDLDACVQWASSNGGDAGRTAITGFCWGGRISWLYAAHSKPKNMSLKAAVAWYGKLVGEASPRTPKHPLQIASNLNTPVLGLYGASDTSIPMDGVDQMKSKTKTAQFVVYPDTPHAFHADYRPSYRKEAADDGWKRTLAWFKANGI